MFSQVVTALTRVVRQTHFISQKILCFVIEFVQLRVVALVPRPGPTLCGAAVLLCRGQLRPGWSSNQNSDASTLRHTRRDGMTWCDCRAFSPLLCLAWTNIRFYCRFGRGEKQTVLWKHLCVCVCVFTCWCCACQGCAECGVEKGKKSKRKVTGPRRSRWPVLTLSSAIKSSVSTTLPEREGERISCSAFFTLKEMRKARRLFFTRAHFIHKITQCASDNDCKIPQITI